MAGAEEQRARDLAEELDRLRVEDVVIQTLVTASALGYRSLGVASETREARDLGQARIAIETMRALIPVLGDTVPAELVRDFHASVASLQLAYAQAVAAAGPPREAAPGAGVGETAADEAGEGHPGEGEAAADERGEGESR